jgi:hypothetical protein
LGKELKRVDKNKGGYASLYAGNTVRPAGSAPTLTELGISKSQSSRVLS